MTQMPDEVNLFMRVDAIYQNSTLSVKSKDSVLAKKMDCPHDSLRNDQHTVERRKATLFDGTDQNDRYFYVR